MPRASLKPGQVIVRWQLGKRGWGKWRWNMVEAAQIKGFSNKPMDFKWFFLRTTNDGTPPTSFLCGIKASHGSRRGGLVETGVPYGAIIVESYHFHKQTLERFLWNALWKWPPPPPESWEFQRVIFHCYVGLPGSRNEMVVAILSYPGFHQRVS